LVSKESARRALYYRVSTPPLRSVSHGRLVRRRPTDRGTVLTDQPRHHRALDRRLEVRGSQPAVTLLKASLPFLAFDGFVYAVGVIEVVAALALILGIGVRYVGLVMLGLFTGTLTIFVISPMVTGFPFLTLTGQLLLKDLVLFAATLMVIAVDSSKYSKVRATTQ
jgi:uncharacterized membrane protein YphA (DoxX/SURF4 family)